MLAPGDGNTTASTLDPCDGSGRAPFACRAANNQWAHLDYLCQSAKCAALQTVGGPVENAAKYPDDFTASTWDKNAGSCVARDGCRAVL
jgi:hypothetical protein